MGQLLPPSVSISPSLLLLQLLLQNLRPLFLQSPNSTQLPSFLSFSLFHPSGRQPPSLSLSLSLLSLNRSRGGEREQSAELGTFLSLIRVAKGKVWIGVRPKSICPTDRQKGGEGPERALSPSPGWREREREREREQGRM